MPVGTQVEQAARYLRMLLQRPGEYRDRWARGAPHGSGSEGDIDYSAVARVLSTAPEQGHGAVSEHAHGAAPRQLASTARRALEGSSLDHAVLTRFVEAFALHPPHARRLAALLDGAPTIRSVSRGPEPAQPLHEVLGQRRYESLSLYESHLVGADGLPEEHQTIQIIRSRVDDLVSVPYCSDTDDLVVEVVKGGSVGQTSYPVGDTLFAVDILLNRPLPQGHTTLLRTHSTFRYRSAPPPELRRGVLGRASDLTMWVRFHPDRLPSRVWRSRWDAIDQAVIVEREPIALDEQLSVHHRFGVVERAVVGFAWEW